MAEGKFETQRSSPLKSTFEGEHDIGNKRQLGNWTGLLRRGMGFAEDREVKRYNRQE